MGSPVDGGQTLENEGGQVGAPLPERLVPGRGAFGQEDAHHALSAWTETLNVVGALRRAGAEREADALALLDIVKERAPLVLATHLSDTLPFEFGPGGLSVVQDYFPLPCVGVDTLAVDKREVPCGEGAVFLDGLDREIFLG